MLDEKCVWSITNVTVCVLLVVKTYACYVSNVGKIWLEQATCPEKVWLLDAKYNYLTSDSFWTIWMLGKNFDLVTKMNVGVFF